VPWLVAATIPDVPAPPPALTTLSRGQQRRELYVILLTFPGFVFFLQSVSSSINQSCGSFLCARAYITIAVLPESVADPCNVLIAPVIKN
jgi:hypothetical protein